MKGLRIYVEGGGDSRRQKATLRTGFQEFLKPLRDAARARRVRWHVILCGSRQAAYDDYRTALRVHPDSINLLLVDAEGPVVHVPWRHLEERDGWENPDVGDDRCHLMVQVVEAWLVADPEALEEYYGQGFQAGALPGRSDVEAISKADLGAALERASRGTQKGRYRKIAHCADLLARISTRKVRDRARHCERLFATVEQLVAG